MKQPALFDAFPTLRGQIPWISILPKPTPTRQLSNLQDALKTNEEIWVKLDNLTSEKYGGNKVRKLEFLLADAIQRHKQQIATLGGLGTNHGLATTIHGQANQLRTRLYLTDQPITPHVLQNLKLLYHFGADMIYAKTRRRANFRFRFLDRLHQRHTYWLPLGGSSPIGVLGFVNAVFELQSQINAGQLPVPQTIFVPVGSLGTIAGIDLGLQLTGLNSRVQGIFTSPKLPDPKRLTALIQRTHTLLRHETHQTFTSTPRCELTIAYAGQAYGAPTAQGNEATQLAQEYEGITLDPTYTAKTLAGTIDYIRQGGKGPILYWHTLNSSNLTALADQVNYQDLPRPFHQFFTAKN